MRSTIKKMDDDGLYRPALYKVNPPFIWFQQHTETCKCNFILTRRYISRHHMSRSCLSNNGIGILYLVRREVHCD